MMRGHNDAHSSDSLGIDELCTARRGALAPRNNAGLGLQRGELAFGDLCSDQLQIFSADFSNTSFFAEKFPGPEVELEP